MWVCIKERDVCVRIIVIMGRLDVCCRCFFVDMESLYVILLVFGVFSW